MGAPISEWEKGWDPTELKTCLGCHRCMRHRDKKAEDFDQPTVKHRSKGKCGSCAQGKVRVKRDPVQTAAAVAQGQLVLQRIRERRQARGITPGGRRLPRSVSTG